MQLNFELVIYDEEQDCFELDETVYQLELDDEATEAYERVKASDLRLYKWLKESDFFLKYIKEEVCQDTENKKIAIGDINGTSYRRFYFFKVTSGDEHYDYFKRLFNIIEESEWQDRENVGEEILEHLSTKRKELILELC
ncbi:MAG: hypothetical protein DSZ05_03130 [Sulfurospirillum sp.]|nr:MAG: hypothetical protein DSZ05_03130 [Sulfurospirillum sp.]